MKKIEIVLHNKEKILLVEVPENARQFDMAVGTSTGSTDARLTYFINGRHFVYPEIKFSFDAEILGEYNPVTGTINFEVKGTWIQKVYAKTEPLYFQYTTRNFIIGDARKSFLSLLKSETEKMWPLKENSFSKRPVPMRGSFSQLEGESFEDAHKNHTQWQESEVKVLPKRFIVLHVK